MPIFTQVVREIYEQEDSMDTRIRCLAIDDEPLAMEIISEYVAKIPELELIGCMTDPIEALKVVQQGDVELVFLDIQMPELTGMQFAKIVGDSCSIILITANPHYAVEGFELDVTDYLLKPISFERFSRSIHKMIANRAFQSHLTNSINGLANGNVDIQQDYMFVKVENRMQRIDFDDIRYIEGLKDYVSIYTDQDRIITLMGMKKMEDVLPQKRFVRVHRSYIVAIDKISSIERNRISLLEQFIPIGETYREPFFKLINASGLKTS